MKNDSQRSELVNFGQCDYFAVDLLVQTTDRPAMRTVEPMREPIFQRELTREPVGKKSFDIVCDAYKNLKPDISIVYDNFGGYRLLYVGNNIVHPPFIFKRNPIGFFERSTRGRCHKFVGNDF